MKIKNIFFAAILVLAGFSCSMEDDAIMNDVEKGIEEATEAYTVLDFGVAFNEEWVVWFIWCRASKQRRSYRKL